MKLIVITTENFFIDEANAVNMLFENGLETLHLRKPKVDKKETENFIKQINTNFHSRIVLHDYYILLDMFNLKGIHLHNRNQKNNDMAQFSTKHMLSASHSCHSLEEVAGAQIYDYVFLSPVFDSISKVGYKKAFTPQQLTEAKENNIINENVIALGGITAENIPTANRYGFGGVAVIGALWGDFAVDGNKDELLKRFDELNIKCLNR